MYTKLLLQDFEYFNGKEPMKLQNLVHVSTQQVCSSVIFVKVRVVQVIATLVFQAAFIALRPEPAGDSLLSSPADFGHTVAQSAICPAVAGDQGANPAWCINILFV